MTFRIDIISSTDVKPEAVDSEILYGIVLSWTRDLDFGTLRERLRPLLATLCSAQFVPLNRGS